MSLRPEPCNEPGCATQIERAPGQPICGGVLFGTRDDPGIGCGRFFCDKHLVGHRGPFYCRPCWDRMKAKRDRSPELVRSDFIDSGIGSLAREQSLRKALEAVEKIGGEAGWLATKALDEVYEAHPPEVWTK